MTMRSNWAVLVGVMLIGLWSVMSAVPAGAQSPFLQEGEAQAAPFEIPRPLTPELAEALLSRLTDAEVRALLREELDRQAALDAAAEEMPGAFAQTRTRLEMMFERIGTRVERWARALVALDERLPQVEKRLATASAGPGGMVTAALGILIAGIGAALATGLVLRRPRAWLAAPITPAYAERFARAIGLYAVELAPVFAFVLVSELVASMVTAELGPLTGMVWIYVAGISWSWAAIVTVRRMFAPDVPALRLADLGDEAAQRVHGLVRRSALIGVGGWLLAGFSPNLGFGFPPAMVIMFSAGTIVALMICASLLRNRAAITRAVAALLPEDEARRGVRSVIALAAPYLLLTYALGAGAYWAAHWLERGQHMLDGPLGTICILLLLPVIDQIGLEIGRGLNMARGESGQRFRGVIQGAWRIGLGLIATIAIFATWGANLFTLTKGVDAAPWASALFDIVVTFLIGALIWRLIRAALHTEVRVSDAAEDADPSQVAAGTRLETLLPLCRNSLLGLLVVIVAMIVLSALGVDIGPLIASAGIIGIAIGFGAQTLVRDVFSGIFFLLDDAFRVGEYIELDDDLRGEVEAISIRSLQLRHHRGPVITIPFGELKQIINHNRDWVIYKMPFRMEPDTDPQKFKKIVKEVGKEFLAHPEHGPKFIEPVKSQGVYYVDDDSALVMRVKFKCIPRAQFVLRREIYHRLRAVFAENDMRIARRKVEVVGGDAGADLGGAALEEGTPASAPA